MANQCFPHVRGRAQLATHRRQMKGTKRSLTVCKSGDYQDDQLIINYNDVCIYGRDLRLLRTHGAWLNDTILHYQLVRLQEQYASDKKILLLDPIVVSFFMHQCEDSDEYAEFWNGCNNGFSGTHRIVLPIVDSMSEVQYWYERMGTHWSLLVLDIHHPALLGYHFDSISQSGNFSSAQQVANKLQTLFHLNSAHHSNSESVSASACTDVDVAVLECTVPKQTNGYDCGIHTLIAAEMIAQEPYYFKIVPNMEQHFHRTTSQWMGNQDFTAIARCCNVMRQRIANDILGQVTPSS